MRMKGLRFMTFSCCTGHAQKSKPTPTVQYSGWCAGVRLAVASRRDLFLGLQMVSPVEASADAGEQRMRPPAVLVLGRVDAEGAEGSDRSREIGACERRRRGLAKSRRRVQNEDEQGRRQVPHRRLHSLLNARSAGKSAHAYQGSRAPGSGIRDQRTKNPRTKDHVFTAGVRCGRRRRLRCCCSSWSWSFRTSCCPKTTRRNWSTRC